MNLTTMLTTLRTRYGTPTGDSFFTDAQLTSLINEALDAISLEHDWPWLQAAPATIPTVVGTRAYAVPADWIRTKVLYIVNFPPLTLAPVNDVLWSTASGQPNQYCVYGDQIQFAPVPDTVYSVVHQYQKTEPDLTTGADIPLMPAVFHHSIVAYSVYLMHVRAGNVQKAQAALLDYRGWLTRMTDHRRRSSAALRPRVRPGGWI